MTDLDIDVYDGVLVAAGTVAGSAAGLAASVYASTMAPIIPVKWKAKAIAMAGGVGALLGATAAVVARPVAKPLVKNGVEQAKTMMKMGNILSGNGSPDDIVGTAVQIALGPAGNAAAQALGPTLDQAAIELFKAHLNTDFKAAKPWGNLPTKRKMAYLKWEYGHKRGWYTSTSLGRRIQNTYTEAQIDAIRW